MDVGSVVEARGTGVWVGHRWLAFGACDSGFIGFDDEVWVSLRGVWWVWHSCGNCYFWCLFLQTS